MVSKPITSCSVTRWVSTPHGMKCPQCTKTVGAVRPLERGLEVFEGFLHHPLPRFGVVPALILGDVLGGHKHQHLVVLDHFQLLTSSQTKALEGLGGNGDLMPRA